VAVDAAASGQAAKPRLSDAERLERWERRSRPAIIASAVIPLIGVASGQQTSTAGVIIEVVSWLVFLVDLVVHMRLHPHYLRTGVGKFDFAVVVLTSPWYLFVGGGQFVALLRLARLARVAMIGFKTPLIKRLADRLGKPFVYVAIILVVAAAIVERAENHKHGFETFGDSLWWGIVTMTTVGYGDLVPETRVGRITAVFVMLTGVALLGTVAASLASLFRAEDVAEGPPEAAGGVAASEPDIGAEVLAELRSLRAEVAALRDELNHRDANP
jgi:voltage-gated potassium channel